MRGSALKTSRIVNEIPVELPRRELQPVAKVEPGYVSTIWAAITHRKSPAGLAFLPASLASGLLAFVQFYGIPAVLTIVLTSTVVVYSLGKANELHARQASCEFARPPWPG